VETDPARGHCAPEGPAPRLALVADDLTGAADAAATFAARGFLSVVALGPGPVPPASVVARFSGGRDVPENEATRLTRRAVRSIRAHREPDRWFLKIDSVLRGHPGPELATTMAALGLERALVCPALPTEGRMVVDGRLRVADQPGLVRPSATRPRWSSPTGSATTLPAPSTTSPWTNWSMIRRRSRPAWRRSTEACWWSMPAAMGTCAGSRKRPCPPVPCSFAVQRVSPKASRPHSPSD
jgi:hypothetical protein